MSVTAPVDAELHRLLHQHRVQLIGRWRADALIPLMHRLVPLSYLPQFLAAARAIESPWGRGRVLVALAPFVPADMHETTFNEILTTARMIEQPRGRIEVSVTLLPYLSKQQQLPLLHEILEIARASLDKANATASPTLALPEYAQRLVAAGYTSDALCLIRAIHDESAQGDALAAVAPHLTTALLWEALTLTRAFTDSRSRNIALSSLSVKLAEAGYLPEALSAAHDIEYTLWRAWALAALVPFAKGIQRNEVVQAALAAARSTDDIRSTAGLLFSYLSEAQQIDLLQEAIENALTIETALWRTQALIGLVQQVPERQRHRIVPIALANAQTIDGNEWRGAALASLVPYAPETTCDEALQIAYAITNDEGRADALLQLVPYLSDQLRDKVIEEILAILQISTMAGWYTGVTIKLIPSLDETVKRTLLERALTLTRKAEGMGHQAMAVGWLAPWLPDDLLMEAFQIASSIGEEIRVSER